MSIFDSLKNAIFGAAPQPPKTANVPPAAPSSAPPIQAASTAPTQAAPVASPVDIQAVLQALAARKQEKLNWQSSIVDLMKLVNLDPSLENRKTLAAELGYTGDTQDSARMNIWLHQQVMQKLAAAGGRVPDSLRH